VLLHRLQPSDYFYNGVIIENGGPMHVLGCTGLEDNRGHWNRYMKAVAGAYGIFGVPYLY
jgi:hypothetical protein